MGKVEHFQSKEQKKHIDNMIMYRLLFLYELLEYFRSSDRGQIIQHQETGFLKNLPLISDAHYHYVLENLTLPDDVIE